MRYFVSYFIIYFFVSIVSVRSAENAPAMQQILQISKQHAKQAKALYWKCSRKDGKYTDEKNLTFDTLDSGEQIAEYEVLFDPVSLKYNVHGKEHAEWIDGDDDYISIDSNHAFDGTVYQGWTSEKWERRTISPHGEISSNLSDLDHTAQSFSATKGFMEGSMIGVLGFILTHTHSYYGMEWICDVFERWEKENKVDSIRMIGDKIEITAQVEVLEGSTDFFLSVLYDPAADMIEQGKLFSRFRGKEHLMEYYEIIFSSDTQNNERIPKESRIVMPLDKRAIIVSYHSFRSGDALNDQSFQITFPYNAHVEDYIEKKLYRVGRPISDEEAREAFLQYHGLTDDVPKRSHSGYMAVRYTLMGIGIALILLSFFLMLRKGRKL